AVIEKTLEVKGRHIRILRVVPPCLATELRPVVRRHCCCPHRRLSSRCSSAIESPVFVRGNGSAKKDAVRPSLATEGYSACRTWSLMTVGVAYENSRLKKRASMRKGNFLWITPAFLIRRNSVFEPRSQSLIGDGVGILR